MKTMPAGLFKARCLRVMEEVKKYRTPVIITKKGAPVAKLVPPDEPVREVFGCMADKLTVTGDVESPVLPPIDAWQTMRARGVARRRAPRRRVRSRTMTK